MTGIAFDPTGARVVTSNEDGTVKIWDAATGRVLQTLSGHASGVMDVAFSPDGNHVATASRDTTIKIWDVSPSAGSEWINLIGHTDRVYDAVYSPDGKYIATAGIEGIAKLWDAITGKEFRTFTASNGSVWSVAFSPDGTRLVTGSGDLTNTGAVQVCDVATGKELLTISVDDFSGRLALSPDGLLLATGGLTGKVTFWNAQTGKNLLTVTDQK